MLCTGVTLNFVKTYSMRNMHGIPTLTIKERSVRAGDSIAGDIARLLSRQAGTVVVVCDVPVALLSVVRKRWLKIERSLRRECSSTVDALKKQRITSQIAWMQARTFSANTEPEALELLTATITFATPADLVIFAPACDALFITCPVTSEQFHKLTAWMRVGSTVIVYRRSV